MRTHILQAGEQVLGRRFEELATLDIDWEDGYLPLVHPLSLRVITVVHRTIPTQSDPWLPADVSQGKLVNIGHPEAKDVAVFTRAVEGIEGICQASKDDQHRFE